MKTIEDEKLLKMLTSTDIEMINLGISVLHERSVSKSREFIERYGTQPTIRSSSRFITNSFIDSTHERYIMKAGMYVEYDDCTYFVSERGDIHLMIPDVDKSSTHDFINLKTKT